MVLSRGRSYSSEYKVWSPARLLVEHIASPLRSTAICMPARSCCNSIAARESRSPHPRFSATVNYASLSSAIGIGTFSWRLSSAARKPSL
jgi:hypothetical protein